jgi:hypothetical protein
MRYVLVTIYRGIINYVEFFDNALLAVRALAEFVREMNIEEEDAEVYSPKGLIAGAKNFLDENNEFFPNDQLMKELTEEEEKPIYIIGNPDHYLGFMVVSPDDPLGFQDPAEAVTELGQMRQEAGNHLKLYRVIRVEGPVVSRQALERCNEEACVEDFDFTLVEEYLMG